MSNERKIALLSDHPDDATFLAEVTANCNANLSIHSSVDQAVDFIINEKPFATFMDISKISQLRKLEDSVQKKIGMFSDLISPQRLYLISESELSLGRDAVLSPLFANFYQRPSHEIELNGEFFSRFVKSEEDNSAERSVKDYLSDQGELQKVELNHTLQKQEAVEAVRQYLISAKMPARISNMIANAVDELLMNALFDAPCDEFGKPLYSSTARTQERDLGEREKVEMSIGFDGFYIAVKVTDHFGSIDRQRLLNHVSANYKDRDYKVKQGQAGAGLGLASVYNSGASLVYRCDVRQKTDTTLLYRAFPSYREFKSQFKFFSAKFYV